MFKQRYSYKCDIWAIGTILYTMLEMKQPFTGETGKEYEKKVEKGIYSLK